MVTLGILDSQSNKIKSAALFRKDKCHIEEMVNKSFNQSVQFIMFLYFVSFETMP